MPKTPTKLDFDAALKDFQMTPVNSSQISEIGYSPALRLLRVQFKNKSIYEYNDVPNEIYEALENAVSVGKFFSANIKGVYAFHRVS